MSNTPPKHTRTYYSRTTYHPPPPGLAALRSWGLVACPGGRGAGKARGDLSAAPSWGLEA